MLSFRTCAATIAACGLLVLVEFPVPGLRADGATLAVRNTPRGQIPASLDDLARLAFEWFADNRDPTSGMVLDRAPRHRGRPKGRMCSIASTGYYLSLLPEWVERGWLGKAEAEKQALVTLEFASRLSHFHGILYHFIDIQTGRRWETSEASLLDTSIFLNGAIVVAEAFGGTVAERVNALVDRVNWPAFLVKRYGFKAPLLSMGWTPESAFVGPMDVRSSEFAMSYFLAIGSTTHPISPDSWYATRTNFGDVAGFRILNSTHPVFTSFYGLAWHHLDGLVDRDGIDLHENARLAALANRSFCASLPESLQTYTPSAGGWWGLSAGDAPGGRYIAVGPVRGAVEGTVWPYAALATVVSIPEVVTADLARWRKSTSWSTACGDYGLAPFNQPQRWVGEDLIGIDLGSFAAAAANARAKTVWRYWMRHRVAVAMGKRLDLRQRP